MRAVAFSVSISVSVTVISVIFLAWQLLLLLLFRLLSRASKQTLIFKHAVFVKQMHFERSDQRPAKKEETLEAH